jgi:hypothetical protein
MDVTKPYKFTWCGDIHGPEAFKTHILCYAVVLPGRKSAFRAGFGRTATGQSQKSALRPKDKGKVSEARSEHHHGGGDGAATFAPAHVPRGGRTAKRCQGPGTAAEPADINITSRCGGRRGRRDPSNSMK